MADRRIAFVAGATGFTGREVVRQLCEAGVRTVAHLRPSSRGAARWEEAFRTWGAEPFCVPWEEEPLRAALAELQPTHVFSLLGTTRARARSEGIEADDIYDTIDRRLGILLLRATEAAGLSPLPRFVYLSSMGASARAKSSYLAARGKVEEALRASKLPYTIARPSVISGEGRDDPRQGERVAATALDLALPIAAMLGAKRLRQRYRPITNVELGRALIRASLDPTQEGVTLLGEDLQRLATLG